MFLVMLTSFVPLSKQIPMLGVIFLVYIALLTITTGIVMLLESRVEKWKNLLVDYEEYKLQKEVEEKE
jgi:hypothetical protein